MTRIPTALALALALLVPAFASAQEADLAGEEAMLARINALRAENQLAPVARLGELDAVARGHTEEMARNGALAHVSSTTGTPEDRVRNAGVESGVVTENVAMHADAAQAHEALLASAPHRGNMLSPTVTHVGISALRADNAVYVTQLFVERQAEAAPEAPEAPSITAPVEAPIEAATEAAAPVFGLIPPFVEQLTGAAEEAATPSAPEAAAQPAAETPAEIADEEPVLEAPAQVAVDAPPAPPAPPAEAAPADAPANGSNAATLQQLVGIGQALLRAVTQPAPVAQQ